MLYEYSLIPDVFDSTLLYCSPEAAKDVSQLLRGIADNGLLADLHKGRWRDHIAALLGAIPNGAPEEGRSNPKDRIAACLKLLDDRNRLVRHPKRANGEPSSHREWLDLAML